MSWAVSYLDKPHRRAVYSEEPAYMCVCPAQSCFYLTLQNIGIHNRDLSRYSSHKRSLFSAGYKTFVWPQRQILSRRMAGQAARSPHKASHGVGGPETGSRTRRPSHSATTNFPLVGNQIKNVSPIGEKTMRIPREEKQLFRGRL